MSIPNTLGNGLFTLVANRFFQYKPHILLIWNFKGEYIIILQVFQAEIRAAANASKGLYSEKRLSCHSVYMHMLTSISLNPLYHICCVLLFPII